MIISIDLGSHEFYLHRAEITKRLIQEKVFEILL
jgi:erythromycin esterase-like protein